MNTINILLPTYNRPEQCLATLVTLVECIDSFLSSNICTRQVSIVISENDSDRLSPLLPDRSYITYASTPQLVSMSQNIANAIKYSEPGFFWIIPDDDYIDKSEFVKTLTFLSTSSADIVGIPYCTISAPSSVVCNDPFFLPQQIKRLIPPFMLLSSLAFRISSKTRIFDVASILHGSQNMYAQNLILTTLPSLGDITICTLNTVPVIYNNAALPRFSGAKGVSDACDIVLTLSSAYGLKLNLTAQEISRTLLVRNLTSTIVNILKNPRKAWHAKNYYLAEFPLFASLSMRLGLYAHALICMVCQIVFKFLAVL